MSRFTEFNGVTDIQFDSDATERLGREYWRLLKPFSFYYNDREIVMKAIVPAGYLMCGKTIPTEFWHLASPMGTYPQLAALDEYLQEYGTVYVKGVERKVDVHTARLIVNQAARVLKTGVEGNRMVASMWAVQDLDKALPVIAGVKNNLDTKWYGNQTLQSIRSFLNKERKETVTC